MELHNIYASKHKCNYYCQPDSDIHTFLVVNIRGYDIDYVKQAYITKLGSENFILIRQVSEVNLEQAEGAVFLPSYYRRTDKATIYTVTAYCKLTDDDYDTNAE